MKHVILKCSEFFTWNALPVSSKKVYYETVLKQLCNFCTQLLYHVFRLVFYYLFMTNAMRIYSFLLFSVAGLVLLIVNILNERKTKYDIPLLQVLLLFEFTWLKTSVLKNVKSSVL